jgi:hypothetical protein
MCQQSNIAACASVLMPWLSCLLHTHHRHSWAKAESSDTITCEASLEIRCSLYERFLEGSYFCSMQENATAHELDDTSDLGCGSLDDASIECLDLGTAQNAAAVNLFMLCSAFAILGVAYWYKERVTEVNSLLLASMLAEFVAGLCAFISAGSYRNYLEAVSTVDVYYQSDTGGGEQKMGTLDMDWEYGYSWTLTIMSGVFSLVCICITSYFYFTDYFNDKNNNRNGQAQDDFTTITNTLGVPVSFIRIRINQ